MDATGFPPDDSVGVAAAGSDRVVRVLDGTSMELLVVHLWEGGSEGANLIGRAEGPRARQAGAFFSLPSWRADRIAPDPDRLVGEP